MLIVVAISKAVQRVRPHLRQGRPVHGYSRNAKDRARRLFEQHYASIDRWILSAVRRLQRVAGGFVASDDAYQSAAEAAFLAFRSYDLGKGERQNYVRRAINLALWRYLREERSRGLVGIEGLYDRLRSAASESEREATLREFPRVEAFREHQKTTPSIEEALEGAQQLLKREEFLADLEANVAANLRGLREYLALKERDKRTWKKKRLAQRRLKVFDLRVRKGLTFRQISSVMGIDVSEAHGDFKQITELIQEAREVQFPMKKSMTAAQIRQWRLLRLLFCLERLEVADRERFPPAHLEFIKRVLAGLVMRLTGQAHSDWE